MREELTLLIERLSHPTLSGTPVIAWGSPIISFGNLLTSKIATLGLNPSNREFVDNIGNELQDEARRFHTLNSLGITHWSDADVEQLNSIVEVCHDYFFLNPYDTWFKKLDYIISGTETSYYIPYSQACHVDIIPYATECKWTDLTTEQRSVLIEIAGDTLGLLLRKSSVELLILNGKSVVEGFEQIAGVKLSRRKMPAWTLPRKSNDGVAGYSYRGVIESIGGIKLKREIKVLGYNHNIQSSFGVTTKVQTAIRNWVSRHAA